ncbi:MAG TPA: helix-turn-helix transcriptional regulator [Treponemataceae bacterium]|nr:helix-turn-helix transcriptional regulator [Treponemataceae bacterium]
MIKYVVRLIAFIAITILILYISGIQFIEIFTAYEIGVVLIGAVLLSLGNTYELLQERNKAKKLQLDTQQYQNIFTKIVASFGKNALITGFFISIVYIFALIYSPEFLNDSTKIVDIFLLFKTGRPLLYGLLFFIVFSLEQKNSSTSLQDSAMVQPSSLSRREIEVARLASKGLTNAQIADLLYISVATVKRHLSTIFQKLEVNSRRELALKNQEEQYF